MLETMLSTSSLDNYFFINLKRIDWLRPLLREGFLSNSEIAIYPQRLRYLYNIALEYPDDVVDVLNHCTLSTSEARWLFLSILRRLPRQHQRVLLPKIEEWKDEQQDSMTFLAIEKMTSEFLKQDNAQGLNAYLTEYLLTPIPDARSTLQPYRTVIASWHYNQFLQENRQSLHNWAWYIPLLLTLLARYRTIKHQANPYAIDAIFGVHLRGQAGWQRDEPARAILSETLNAIKDVSIRKERFDDLWQQLQRRPDSLFSRLRLLMLAECLQPALKYIEEMLLDRRAFEVYPEYKDAVQAHFDKLPAASQQVIWGWIGQSLPSDVLLHELRGDDAYREGRELRQEWRKLARLAPHLPPDLLVRWRELTYRFGDGVVQKSSLRVKVGTQSSVTPDMLAAKTIPEVVELLKADPPATGDDDFDHQPYRVEGLADVVSKDAIRRPGEYLIHWRTWQDVESVYLYHIVSAFRTSDAEQRLPMQSFLELFEFVCQKSRQNHADRNWTWAVGAMADYLEHELKRENSVANEPLDLPQLRAALVTALADPDPPADTHIENLDNYGDAFTRSLNVTRGKVMHALIRLMGVLQARAAEENDSQATAELNASKQAVLQHIRDEVSSAVCVAVVPTLPWFDYHDPAYSKRLAEVLFDRSAVWRSAPAWDTHLHWNRYYNRMFLLLRQYYAEYASIDLPSTEPLWPNDPATQEKFADHLGMFYVRQQLQLDEPDQLLDNFLQYGDGKAIGSLFSFVTGALEHTEGEIGEYVARIQVLWKTVLAEWLPSREPADQMPIRSAFVSLFTSDKFDLQWKLAQLRAITPFPRAEEEDYALVKTLTDMVGIKPIEVLTILAELLRTQPVKGLAIRQVKILLDQMMDKKSDEVDVLINEIADQYAGLGFIEDFRPLYRR